jgi:hypothetical protein
MSNKDRALSLLSGVAATLGTALENLEAIRKQDGEVENLRAKKGAVREPLESLASKLEELTDLVTELEEKAGPVTPVVGVEAADRQAVSRMRQGERLQLVSRGPGRWAIDFRTDTGGVVTGEDAEAVHQALVTAEAIDGFPQLPDQGEQLTDDEADAIARLAAVGDAFECNVRWESNGTHSKHNFGGTEVVKEWAGERGLIVEPVQWLEEEREKAANGNGNGNGPKLDPDLEAAWSALQNAQGGTQIARVTPNAPRYNGGPFIFEDNKENVIGEGSEVETAYKEYVEKGGRRAGEPSELSTLDLEQAAFFSKLGNVTAPTSVRKSNQGVICDYFRSRSQAGPELHDATTVKGTIGEAIQELRRVLGSRI